MVKNNLFLGIFLSIFGLILFSFLISAGDFLALQGTVQNATSTNVTGNLVVTIYDDFSAGNMVYNSTTDFNGKIYGGKYNVVLGNGSNTLNLEYGKKYYMELYINNERQSFNGTLRQVFQSSVGQINQSLNLTALNVTGNISASHFFGNGSQLTSIIATMDYTNISMLNKSNDFGHFNQSFNGTTLFIDTRGRVGIGTTLPAADLGIKSYFNTSVGIVVQNLNESTAALSTLSLGANTSSGSLIVFSSGYNNNGNSNLADKFLLESGAASQGLNLAVERVGANITFFTKGGINAANETMNLDALGNLNMSASGNITTFGRIGVGTANPSALLSIGLAGAGNYGLNVSGRLYVNDSSVGIGTSNPSGILELYQNTTNSGLVQWMRNMNNDSGSMTWLVLASNNSDGATYGNVANNILLSTNVMYTNAPNVFGLWGSSASARTLVGTQNSSGMISFVIGAFNVANEVMRLTNDSLNMSAGKNISASHFFGNGSQLTSISATMDYTNIAMANQTNAFGDLNQSFNSTTLFIDANRGRIGIGTNNPASGTIQLLVSTNNSNVIYIENTNESSAATPAIQLKNSFGSFGLFMLTPPSYSVPILNNHLLIYGTSKIGGIDLISQNETSNISFYIGGLTSGYEKARLDYLGNLNMTGYGNVSATYFIGNGSQLTDISATMNYANLAFTNQTNVFGDVNQSFNGTGLFFNANKGRLGLGTINPAAHLHITSSIDNASIGGYVQNTNESSNAQAAWNLGNNNSVFGSLNVYGGGYTNLGNSHLADRAVLSTSGAHSKGLYIMSETAGSNISFFIGGKTTANEKIRITSEGSLVLIANLSVAITCDAANAGGIYYDNSTSKHYGCNGSAWNAFY